jgi:hypothetical protein
MMCAVPVFTKDDRSVLFVHIPKAAGSTLERMFTRSGWEMALRETRKTHPQLMPLRRCSPQHYHAALLSELFEIGRFDAVFTLTREPVSRFRSEYLMRNHQDPRTDAASVEAWADRALARRESDPYTLDNHLRPQHEFLLPGAQVYRLEDGLESTVADLNERFDLGLTTAVLQAMSSVRRAGVSSSAIELSDRLHATLRSVYAEDYARLDYG